MRTEIASIILELAGAAGPEGSISPNDAAKEYARRHARPNDPPDKWRMHLTAVKTEMVGLARAGEIVILRKGKPVDPHAPFRGIVRLRIGASETEEPDGGPGA